MSLRISSRKDWIDEHFGGLAKRSNELPCPTRWECFVETLRLDLLPLLGFRRRKSKDSDHAQ